MKPPSYTPGMSSSLRNCTRRAFAVKSHYCPYLSSSIRSRHHLVLPAGTIVARTMSYSPTKRLAPRSFPTSGFKVIDHSELFQEEALLGHKAELYYPVNIGEVFNERYQVMGKLGYGVTSTVWLARDLV